MILVLQSSEVNCSPVWQTPCHPGMRCRVGSGANDGLSGQMPESRTPTTTPAPAPRAPVPPSRSQRPPGLLRPRNAGVLVVSSFRFSSLTTARTPAVRASRAASPAVIAAAKPLKVTE